MHRFGSSNLLMADYTSNITFPLAF